MACVRVSRKRAASAAIALLSAALLAGCASRAGAGANPTGGLDGCTRGEVPADLACVKFVSQSGTDGSAPVAWLGTTPLTVWFEEMNSTPTAVVLTPCNALNVPVKIDGRELTPDAQHTISTDMGCMGEAGEQQGWALDFVTAPMTYELHGDVLTLSTASASVVLKRA